ncbi:MAG: hypothetical protein MUF28_12095 [Ignavibacterium sp.]|jgi:hypothetical protein|nr:hypothetical protein [Ignavibacterium sp.]
MRAAKIIILVFVLLRICGCGKEENFTPNEKTEELLVAQIWELAEVNIDGVMSDLYSGLTLSFGSKTYTTTNGGKIWPASGDWEFIGEKGDKILRDDGLEIDIISINASQLVLSFTWNSTIYDGGRTGSLKGLHQMTFKRKNQ